MVKYFLVNGVLKLLVVCLCDVASDIGSEPVIVVYYLDKNSALKCSCCSPKLYSILIPFS